MDFSFLHASPFLSDFKLTILERGDGDSVKRHSTLPVHAAVLAASSNYYRTLLSSWHHPPAEDASSLSLTVEEGSAPACCHLLAFMYTGILPESLDQPSLMKTLQLADYLQCTGAIKACLRRLSETTDADLNWDTAAAILALPEGFALSAGPSASASPACSGGGAVSDKRAGGDLGGAAVPGAGGGGGSPVAVSPHQQYYERAVSIAQRKVLAELGDIEAAWRDDARKSRFLALPAAAVVHLLTHPHTSVASENTVLIALASWVAARGGGSGRPTAAAPVAAAPSTDAERSAAGAAVSPTISVSVGCTGGGGGGGATDSELDSFVNLVRLQHLTVSFLNGVAPQVRWFWSRLIADRPISGPAGGNGSSSSSGTGGGVPQMSLLRQLLGLGRAARAGPSTVAAFASGRPGLLRAGPRPRSSASDLTFTWELTMTEVRAAIADVRAARVRRNLRSPWYYYAGYQCALALNLHAVDPAPPGSGAATMAEAAATSGYRAFLGILIEAVKDGPLVLDNDETVMVAIVRGTVACQRLPGAGAQADAAATSGGGGPSSDGSEKTSRYALEGPMMGGSWGVMNFFDMDAAGEARWADFTVGGRLLMRCTLAGLE